MTKKLFTLLSLLLCAVGSNLWASDITISLTQGSATVTSGTEGDILLTTTGSYTKATDDKPGLQMKQNQTITLNGNGNLITAVTFTMTMNGNDVRSSSLSNLTISANEDASWSQTFKGKKYSDYGTITHNLTSSVGSITYNFTTESGNTASLYIASISVTYAKTVTPYAGTYPYTWNFAQDRWENSVSQMRSNTGTWNVADESDNGVSYVSSTAKDGFAKDNGIDMLNGLAASGYANYDSRFQQLYVQSGNTITVPNLKAGYVVTIVTANNKTFTPANATLVSGETSTFQVTSDGDATFTPSEQTWIFSIAVTTSLPFKYTTEIVEGTQGTAGKFTITRNGELIGGTKITELPGITMTFGTENEAWTTYNTYAVQKETSVTKANQGNNAVVDGTTKLPTSGTYYKFEPTVYGFLKVNGAFWRFESILLVAINSKNNTNYYYKTVRNTDQYAEYATYEFGQVLEPGVTYYLYSLGGKSGGSTDFHQASFALHSFTFEPAFVFSNEDISRVTSVSAYTNLENDFPNLIEKATTGVAFSNSSNGVATVNTQSGDITLTKTAGTETITGTVTNGSLTTTTTYTINAAAKDEVFKVTASTTASVQQRVEVGTDAYVAFTYGGCDWIDLYNYYKQGTGYGPVSKKDEYGKAKKFSGGNIDGFGTYIEGNNNNPKDEAGYNFKQGTYADLGRFNVPCRGTFYKFQAYADGDLTVYFYQNGITDNYNNTTAAQYADEGAIASHYNPHNPVNYRRLWIVDETGTPVTLKDWETNAKIPGEYTGQNDANETAEDFFSAKIFKDYWSNKHTDEESDVLQVPENPSESNQAKVASKTAKAENLVILNSGIVKYKFHIESGKTYFFFVNRSASTGISGVVFDKDDRSFTNATFAQNDSYTAPATTKNVKAVLSGRTIKANVWQPICLPFSVDEKQVKDIFGEGTKIAHFDNTEGDKLTLKTHAYHYIVAGVPCFIKATKAYSNADITFPSVTVEKSSPEIVAGNGSYSLVGNFANTTVPNGGYFVSAQNNQTFFYKATTAVSLKAFRCYLNPAAGANELTANFMEEDFEDMMPTSIGGIILDGVEESNIHSTGIFNLSGQRFDSTENLPKGVYIVNGKKIIVK